MALDLPTTKILSVGIPNLTNNSVETRLEIWSYGLMCLCDHISIYNSEYALPLSEAHIDYTGFDDYSDPYFSKFHTLPSWQGRGLGRLVFAASIFSVFQHKRSKMWWYAVTNPSGMRMYEEFGARPLPYKAGNWFADRNYRQLYINSSNAHLYLSYLKRVR